MSNIIDFKTPVNQFPTKTVIYEPKLEPQPILIPVSVPITRDPTTPTTTPPPSSPSSTSSTSSNNTYLMIGAVVLVGLFLMKK